MDFYVGKTRDTQGFKYWNQFIQYEQKTNKQSLLRTEWLPAGDSSIWLNTRCNYLQYIMLFYNSLQILASITLPSCKHKDTQIEEVYVARPYKLHRLQPKWKAETRLACDLAVLWWLITVRPLLFQNSALLWQWGTSITIFEKTVNTCAISLYLIYRKTTTYYSYQTRLDTEQVSI